jgi:hypothetical protein
MLLCYYVRLSHIFPSIKLGKGAARYLIREVYIMLSTKHIRISTFFGWTFCRSTFCCLTFCCLTFCHLTFCHLTFCRSTFSHSTFCHLTFCHSTFCYTTFCHSTFCRSTFCHSTKNVIRPESLPREARVARFFLVQRSKNGNT